MGTDRGSQPEIPQTDGTEPDGIPLLQIKALHTQFETKQGTVRAVDGLSLDLYEGEVLGLVGESGCGKTMTALSIMRLLPGNGQAVAGEIEFEGKNLLECNSEEMKKIRGGQIAMIFQEPMTALTPTMTIGRQISEAMEIHLDLSRDEARERALELLEHVGIPSPRARFDNYIHQFSGGMRQRVMIAIAFSCEPRSAASRRADHGAGRDGAGADPGPDQAAGAGGRHDSAVHHSRHGHRGRQLRPGCRYVRRTHG